MKKNILKVAALVLVTGALAFTAANSSWTINVPDSKITFDMPNGKHNGTVGGLNATFEFDPASPELAHIKAVVDVKSLKADNEKLTAHLMTADFFDAEKHPTITFTSDKVTKNDSGFVATGTLAMRDSVKTVEIPFTFKQDGKKAVVHGKLDIFSGDYGVGQKSSKGNDRVVIDIEVPVSKE